MTIRLLQKAVNLGWNTYWSGRKILRSTSVDAPKRRAGGYEGAATGRRL